MKSEYVLNNFSFTFNKIVALRMNESESIK